MKKFVIPVVLFFLSHPSAAFAQALLDFSQIDKNMGVVGQIFRIQSAAAAAKQCAQKYVPENELNALGQKLSEALPRLRAMCDEGKKSQAAALARSLEQNPKVKLANKACDVHRLKLSEAMSGILAQVPPDLSPKIIQMIKDLQRTPQNPCP